MKTYKIKSHYPIRLCSNVTSKVNFYECLTRNNVLLLMFSSSSYIEIMQRDYNNHYLSRISISLENIGFDFAKDPP